MSKIFLFVEPTISAHQKMDLSKITSKSLSSINESIEMNVPFLDYTLFMNDYPEIAEKLVGIMALIEENKAHFFEVEDDFQFRDLSGIKIYEISYPVLSNILESASEYN